MKNIEDLIKGRREEFDQEQPLNGHFERFNSKIPRDTRVFEILKIAAIITVGLIMAAATYLYSSNNESLDQYSSELEETIFYYQSLNLEKENQLMSLPLKSNGEREQIKTDLEVYDKQYRQLMEDLKKYPNDQRVINAVIEYHRSRSEMLEHILYQLDSGNV